MQYFTTWSNFQTPVEEGGKGGGGMDHEKKAVSQSRVLKKQFHGKQDSNKII
jgi:hypothetical protein